jgi:predicted O-methyltransferase YrrM
MRQFIEDLLTKFFIWRVTTTHPKLKQSYQITSHLTPHERYQLFKLAINREKILEIGSYVGASATCFGAAKAKNEKGTIYCIDTWQNDAMTEGKKDTQELFTENTKAFAQWITPIRGFSTEVAGQVKKYTDKLDVLFIDGDHSYEGVKADWETYKGFLNPGSIVIFHDIGWAEGVQRVIKEDVTHLVSSSDSLPNLWWATIAKKP